MPVLSYVHQLFNTETCQAYIHALRWKDRPLQCPRWRALKSGGLHICAYVLNDVQNATVGD